MRNCQSFTSPMWLLLVLTGLWTSHVVAFCPSQCQCNDHALETNCMSARLDVVPILLNPALRSLKLAHNRITTIRQSLDFYADLEVLDLSHNSIDALGKRHFESQIMLTSLNLSYNSLHYLEEQAFSGLTQLQVLDLRHNHLTRIDDYVLGDLEELTDLDLSFNSIEYLSSECFTSLYRLRSLNLNSNRLQMVPSASLQSLVGLMSLDLSLNSIAQLDGESLESLVQLRDLNLANNTLHHIHLAAFEGLSQLLVLDLSWNRLGYVPGESLMLLPTLLSLDLSSNYIERIGPFAFNDLRQLESLRLSSMSTLQYIDGNAFASLNNSLQTLIVSDNKLWTTLDPRVISSLKRLRYVDLSGNGLATVAPVQWPSHLEYFDLSGNPLECNCSMHWLWQSHMRATNRSSVPMKDIICHGPAHLQQQHFFQLEESHLVCFSAGYIVLVSLVSGLLLAVFLALSVLCCYWHRQRQANCSHVKHLANNMMQPSSVDSPPFKSKTLSLPKTVDYYLNDDDYVYHPASGPIKPIPVTAV